MLESKKQNHFPLNQQPETEAEFQRRLATLRGSGRKSQFCLKTNLEEMCASVPIERIGVLTLTVGDWGADGHFKPLLDAREGQRRLHNLNRKVLPLIFERWVTVMERTRSGAVHYHLVGVCRARDIRGDIQWSQVQAGCYGSVCPVLRDIWAVLRVRLPQYGFGRHELLPVRKVGKAVACYVAKYVGKSVACRPVADRRLRLVRYSGWLTDRLKPNSFSWATKGSLRWHAGVGEMLSWACVTWETAGERLGGKWAYRLQEMWQAVSPGLETMPGEWAWIDRAVITREILHLEHGR